MLAIIVIAAGYALIFGAKGAFDRLVRITAGLILILSFAPGVLSWMAGIFGDLPRLQVPHVAPVALVGGALAVVGYVAWKLRPVFARRAEGRRRRSGAPRDRVLPPAPKDDDQ